MSIEDAIDEFIEEAINAAQAGDPLHGADLHDTVYLKITKDYGVRIGDCESSISLLPGGGAEEFDADVTLVFYSRVIGQDKSQRKAARNQARSLALAVASLFLIDPSMGGRVRDCILGRLKRGYDSLADADSYAVGNLPLTVNFTGQQLEG